MRGAASEPGVLRTVRFRSFFVPFSFVPYRSASDAARRIVFRSASAGRALYLDAGGRLSLSCFSLFVLRTVSAAPFIQLRSCSFASARPHSGSFCLLGSSRSALVVLLRTLCVPDRLGCSVHTTSLLLSRFAPVFPVAFPGRDQGTDAIPCLCVEAVRFAAAFAVSSDLFRRPHTRDAGKNGRPVLSALRRRAENGGGAFPPFREVSDSVRRPFDAALSPGPAGSAVPPPSQGGDSRFEAAGRAFRTFGTAWNTAAFCYFINRKILPTF